MNMIPVRSIRSMDTWITLSSEHAEAEDQISRSPQDQLLCSFVCAVEANNSSMK